MAGKSPRLRARALADVFYKEELILLDEELTRLNLRVQDLEYQINVKNDEVAHLTREYEKKVDEHERMASANKKIKADCDYLSDSNKKQIESLKLKLKELKESIPEESKKKKKE